MFLTAKQTYLDLSLPVYLSICLCPSWVAACICLLSCTCLSLFACLSMPAFRDTLAYMPISTGVCLPAYFVCLPLYLCLPTCLLLPAFPHASACVLIFACLSTNLLNVVQYICL